MLKPLLPVAEAQARLLALARPGPIESVPLAAAAGRWAAADVTAGADHPFADLSAMDGYAIRFAELPGPWTVTQAIAAGTLPARPLAPGAAARIFTGAPLPAGADTILIQEEAARDGDRLTLAGEGPPVPGVHVRRRAMNFRKGQAVIRAGDRLSAARIGLAAMAGHARLPVRPRARIALISTGDELVSPGDALAPGQIWAANAPMLAALLADLPVAIDDLGVVPDRRDALDAALARAASADVIVTSGGASVGEHDLVRPALEAAGARLDFWRIAMRPGKPLMAGRLGESVALGLPGNPVSAFVTAFLFLRPLVAALGGAADPLPRPVRLPLAEALPANGARADYLRARIANGMVAPAGRQDSSSLIGLAEADALIVRPVGAPAVPAGMFADVHILA